MRLNLIVSSALLAFFSRLGLAGGAIANHLRGLSEDSLLVLPTRGNASQLQRADFDRRPPKERGWQTPDQLLVPPYREPGLLDAPLLERPTVPVAMLEVQEAPRQARGWSLFSALQAAHAKILDTSSAVVGGTEHCWEAAIAHVEASVDSLSWRFKAFLSTLSIASLALCTAGIGYQLGRKDDASDQALRGGSTNEWWA